MATADFAVKTEQTVKTGQTAGSREYQPLNHALLAAPLPDAIRAAFDADNGQAVHRTEYASVRKNASSVAVILSTGQPVEWRPADTGPASTITRGNQTKLNEWDVILRDACSIRGGTIVAIGWRPVTDDNGFRKSASTSYQRIRRALDTAYMRLPLADRMRVDPAFLVVANDVNAPDASTVEGYVLVKVRGGKVK